jgi:hypothetical protein
VVCSIHDWFDLLKKVLHPVREEIMNRKPTPELSQLETEPLPIDSFSLKLRVLISMLCDKFCRTTNLPLPLETICQLIEMHTKKFARPSRQQLKTVDKISRIDREKETKIPQILTLKLSKTIRAKGLMQVYFHHGINLSPKRWYLFIDEVMMTMLDLCRRSGNRALPSSAREGIFSVFIDDNLDENSSSPSSVVLAIFMEQEFH